MKGKSVMRDAKNRRNSWLRWIWIPAAAVAAAACFLLCFALQKEEERKEEADPYAKIYRYPMEGVNAFCVGEDGTVYLVRKGSNLIEGYNMVGEKVASYRMDMDGITEITNEREIEIDFGKKIRQIVRDELAGLCCQDGKLYCFRGSTGALFCLNLASGEGEVVWQTESGKAGLENGEISQMIDLAVSGDSVAFFFQGEREAEAEKVANDVPSSQYLYFGERMALLDLKSGTLSLTEYRNLVCVTAKGHDGFLVEGYDQEMGYYFAELSKEGVMSEKCPAGIASTLYFGWDEEAEMFHGALSLLSGSSQCISGTLKEAQSAYRYYSNELKVAAHSVRCSCGYLYLLDCVNPDRTGTLVRLEPALFLQEGEPLKAILTNEAEVEEPDWQGHPVEVESMEAYDLALKLLAGDDDFDFIVMSTAAAEAWNIRRVMAYYPLNEVAGDLLDSCFPAVQGAAKNGEDIWALPLGMDAAGLVYSEENAKKAGTSFEGITTIGEWAEQALFLHRQDYNGLYAFPYRSMESWLIQHYVNVHLDSSGISFHTEEFENILNLLLEGRRWEAEEGFAGSADYPRERYQHVFDYVRSELGNTTEAAEIAEQAFYDLFCQDIILWWPEVAASKAYTKFQGREGFLLIPLPTADGSEGEFQATLQVLVVNPNSRRLKRAVQVAGKLAKGAMKNPENWLAADRQCYLPDAFTEQIYQACSRAVVYQVPPAELYDKHCYDYFSGSISREELLDTLERVLNAYYLE